jgi:hypothetical protein
MDTDKERATGRLLPKFFLLSAFICVHLWFLSQAGSAQEGAPEPVAHPAAGRVVLAVASDGIVVGAVERRAEPGAKPPLILPLGGRRVGILLGAIEWTSPGSHAAPVRLDRELLTLGSEARPRPAKDPYPGASDIEMIGVAFLERLRAATGEIHRKLDLKPHEPLAELLLVDYVENYGPEIWLLKYHFAQEAFRGDYWRTRVLRPSYTQLYPPEKGQPHTLIEVRYPEDPGPALKDLLKQNDPRLARLGSADSAMTRAFERLARGESHKAHAGDVAAFLRAALGAVAGTEVKQTLGVLYEQRGFEWVLAPSEPPEKAQEGKPREPGAPTLRKPQ